MASTALENIAQIPIERILSFPLADLEKLAKEANEALLEAKSLKDWINGIMAIKKSIINDEFNKHYAIDLGGKHEQITDY